MRFLPGRNFRALFYIWLASAIGLIHGGEPVEGWMTFIFVIATWIIGLCLHEFAHAYAAWHFGDYMVEHRGFLSWNPLKYIRWQDFGISLMFLMIGGIVPPGAQVTYLPHIIHKPHERTWLALAGPLGSLVMTLIIYALFAVVKLTVFSPEYGYGYGYIAFAGALALSAYLLTLSVFVNLLPVPGLDGYLAIEAYLPERVQKWGAWLNKKENGYWYMAVWIIAVLGAIILFGPIVKIMFAVVGLDEVYMRQGYENFNFWK